MNQNVWIFNHYATNMFFDKGGRHYWFAENLTKKGYNPTIFCASTNHFSDNHIDTKGNKYLLEFINNIPFVFINTPEYKGNGKKRIINMFSFYRKLFSVSKDYAKLKGNPDVIVASSVHPLTQVAGIKIAKKLGVPCICEVRDLWPESIAVYKGISKHNPIIWIMYKIEKLIYKKADRIIFTMEGGKDYVVDKKWHKKIDMSKIYHINNGVKLEEFDYNKNNFLIEDADLDNANLFKVVYAGSIRQANNLGLIIDSAKYIQESCNKNIKIIIFGDGDEKENLQKRCIDEKINNIIFKGKVEKKYIANILSKSDLNILNYSNHDIWKYGGSQNKIFEYLASGKPVLSTIKMGYDIIEKYNAGISLKEQTQESIGQAILSIARLNKEQYEELSNNALKAAKDYDFNVLTEKLIDIIEEV